MINREFVERYLRANGVTPPATEDQIKEVLFSAKWHESDVDTALMVLRENPQTKRTKIQSLHKVYHSDERLEPETISALLGIDVNFENSGGRARRRFPYVKFIFIVAVSAAAVAGTVFIAIMWHLKMGIFYVG